MKKKLCFLLLFVSIQLLGTSAPAQITARPDSVAGRIKSIREMIIFLDSNYQNLKLFSTEGDYGHNGFLNAEYTIDRFTNWWYNTYWVHYLNYFRVFDSAGRMTEDHWFSKSGGSMRQFRYTYRDDGKLLEERDVSNGGIHRYTTFHYWDQTDTLLRSTMDFFPARTYTFKSGEREVLGPRFRLEKFQYDSLQRLTRVDHIGPDSPEGSYLYTYDAHNRVLTKSNYWPYIKVKNGRTISSQYDPIGTTTLTETYKYNDHGLPVQIRYFREEDSKSLLTRTETLSYDSLDRKVRLAFDSLSYTTYKFNSAGQLSEIEVEGKVSVGFDPRRVQSYSYNTRGLPQTLIYKDEDGTQMVTFEYQFDKMGNWITSVKIVNGQPRYKRTRQIEYYP